MLLGAVRILCTDIEGIEGNITRKIVERKVIHMKGRAYQLIRPRIGASKFGGGIEERGLLRGGATYSLDGPNRFMAAM